MHIANFVERIEGENIEQIKIQTEIPLLKTTFLYIQQQEPRDQQILTPVQDIYVNLYLYSKHIIIERPRNTQENSIVLEDYQQKNNQNKTEFIYFKIKFDFDVKFTLLREKVLPPLDKTKVGDPYGLRFQKSPILQKTLELHSKQKKELLAWRDQLAKRINQRDFHELYRPFRKIGKGNSATVYLAERKQDGKKIAIKAFAKEALTVQTKGRQSLLNQINIMRALDHQCLMKLFQVFQTNNSFYLAIEHLEGGQLFEKINNRRFTLLQIREILKRLVEGLQYLHQKRIIHRDLKPQNLIFRSPGGNDLVIADFGLATWADQQQYIFVRCGTPGYVAPQIINFKGKNGQDPISDIFSLGVIAHILATARSPFPGKEYQIVLQQNRYCNFNFGLQIYKMVEPSLLDLIIKMMEVNPQKRIKTKDILLHPFFNQQIITIPNPIMIQLMLGPIAITQAPQANLPDQCTFIPAIRQDQNSKNKQRKKLQDSIGSFVVGKPNLLKGNDEEYVSINNMVGSTNSVPQSPKSIKIDSKFKKREREPEIESRFKQSALPKKKIQAPHNRIGLDQLREKGQQQKEELKKEE